MSPRIQFAGLLAIAGAGVLLWALYRPDARKARAPQPQAAAPTPRPAAAPTPAPKIPARPASPAPDPGAAPSMPALDMPVAQLDPDAEVPDAEVEQGPFEVSLGQHMLFLDDPDQGRVLRTSVILTVADAEARRAVQQRHKKLVRMLYFLATRRKADPSIGGAGRRRFEADYLGRINNVIPDAAILDVRFEGYSVGPRPRATRLSELPPR